MRKIRLFTLALVVTWVNNYIFEWPNRNVSGAILKILFGAALIIIHIREKQIAYDEGYIQCLKDQNQKNEEELNDKET